MLLFIIVLFQNTVISYKRNIKEKSRRNFAVCSLYILFSRLYNLIKLFSSHFQASPFHHTKSANDVKRFFLALSVFEKGRAFDATLQEDVSRAHSRYRHRQMRSHIPQDCSIFPSATVQGLRPFYPPNLSFQ